LALFSVSAEASEYGISLKHKRQLFLHVIEITFMFRTEKCTNSPVWVTWCIDCYFVCPPSQERLHEQFVICVLRKILLVSSWGKAQHPWKFWELRLSKWRYTPNKF